MLVAVYMPIGGLAMVLRTNIAQMFVTAERDSHQLAAV